MMRAVCLATLLAVGACAADSSELGVVSFYGTMNVEVPEKAAVGERIRVYVETYGNACVSFGSTEVIGATVRPFDQRSDGVCNDILVSIPHETFVTFDSPGAHTIRVIGRHVDSDVDTIIEVPSTVDVE